MGLDTSAYRGLSRYLGELDANKEPVDGDIDGTRLYANPDFPHCAPEIEDGFYQYEEWQDGIGYPYSYHMRFRDELAKLSGWPDTTYEQHGREWPSYTASAWKATGGPFWELLNFSDCEGAIGTTACVKLARDFAEFQAKADAHPDERFRENYATWRRNFEFASDRGAVKFH